MANPTVTIGLASYNRPHLLTRSIQSIKSQTYPNLEIIVSDNGSSDEVVRKLIEDFQRSDDRVKVFFHKENKGPFFNFRFLLEAASGEYFIWLADDDYYDSGYIDALLTEAVRGSASLSYSRAVFVDNESGKQIGRAKEMPSSVTLFQRLLNFARFDSDSIFYGLFKREEGLKYAQTLKNWNLPSFLIKDFGFVRYDFVSYVFILGLLLNGPFVNASHTNMTHYCGNVSSLSATAVNRNKFSYLFRVAILVLLNVYIHVQFCLRLFMAAFSVRQFTGVILSPIIAGYFLFRRLYVIIRTKLRRA